MIQKEKVKDTFTILNDKGLHTRPATELVKCVSNFKCQVFLHFGELSVNAKSLLGILMLAASKGAKIRIEAEGDDAGACVAAVLELAKKKFHMKY